MAFLSQLNYVCFLRCPFPLHPVRKELNHIGLCQSCQGNFLWFIVFILRLCYLFYFYIILPLVRHSLRDLYLWSRARLLLASGLFITTIIIAACWILGREYTYLSSMHCYWPLIALGWNFSSQYLSGTSHYMWGDAQLCVQGETNGVRVLMAPTYPLCSLIVACEFAPTLPSPMLQACFYSFYSISPPHP